MRPGRSALLSLLLLGSATLLLAGCGANLFDKVSNFWSLGCCGSVLIILNILALIELAGDARSTSNKVVWALVIIFAPYLGCIAYYLFGR